MAMPADAKTAPTVPLGGPNSLAGSRATRTGGRIR
jgi:hypothetical protein